MHGYNEKRGREKYEGRLQVAECFFTIQGEGPHAGLPAIFLRLTGCNLSCHFCDTAWLDNGDPWLTPAEIVGMVHGKAPEVWMRDHSKRLLVITGGEPARQELAELLKELRPLEYRVQIETAGTFWQDCFYAEEVELVCSPKTAKVHPQIKAECAHWKYVIRAKEVDPKDGLPSHPYQRFPGADKFMGGAPARPPRRKDTTVYVQPCDEGEFAEEQTRANTNACVLIAQEYGYRVSIQQHKILGVE